MLYTYKCKACEEIWDESHPMDDRKIPEGLPCPKCNKEGEVYQYLGAAPKIVREAGSRIKTDDGFKEVLSKVQEKYTINNIDKSRY